MKSVTTIGQISRVSAVATLVVLYLFSTVGPASLHEIFHQENKAELHIAENEKDPCHRKLFHNDTQAGCKHTSHVSGHYKCPVCVSLIYKDHLPSLGTSATVTSLTTISHAPKGLPVIDRNHQHLSARAPPAIA